ncbi:uncharacterized protein LOC135982924 [Chrysemys picta bellii]|uniref:uncharacterized protein LOC135982924 n=1 Tax=Chrysemys picta bellii TaxID=8478 RepID=UPI0032B2B7C6
MQSSPAEMAMQSQNRKRAPAWTDREVLDLIAVWGDESVLSELRSKRRNAKIYEKISKAMTERGYSQDAMQCHVKIKELRQGYQKTKEANGRSGSQPQTCRFYKALHSILGAAATTTPPLTVDSEDGILSTPASSEMVVDGEDEDEAVDSAYNADFPNSQDLFITLTEIPYQPSPGVNPDPESEEGSAAVTVSRPTRSSDSQRLAQIRRRKKRTRDDMFSELMGCSRAEATQQTQWRENMSQYQRGHSEREERWRQEDQQATQTLLGLMREQMDTLWRLVDVLQDRRQEDRAPLQSICNHCPPPQSPISPHPKYQEGGAAESVKTVTLPLQSAQVPEGCHSPKFEKSFPSRLTQAPIPVSSPNCLVANKKYVSVNYCFHPVFLEDSLFEGGEGGWYRHGGRFSSRSHTQCSH